MKLIKKIHNIFLIIVLLSCSFFVNIDKTSAKTLRELKDEYNKTLKEYKDNENKEKLTQAEINKINQNIVLIQTNIEKGQKEIIELNEEIADYEDKMAAKDDEIKRILKFLQVSEGENAYLEYAFGAKTFTDFIYRMAVTEQLANYNDKLIQEYNEMIKANERRKEEIKSKEVEMQKQQVDLQAQLSKLKSQMSQIYEDYIDISESLKVQEEIIKMYENDYKCGLDDEIQKCAANALPSDTTFWRPTNYGYISSNYGMRWHPTQGGYKLHAGLDAAMGTGTAVYSVAAGTVASKLDRFYCGGNMVFIIHRVNGQYYTSVYMHLSSMTVNVGDVVTKDTIIGYSGGDPRITTWDSCSTGAHLHLTMLYGRIGIDYYAWSDAYYANAIDPRQVINYPALYKEYHNRTTRY